MDDADGGKQGTGRVLVSVQCEGQRLQMVRQEDDVAIIMDGQPLYRWPAGRVESCVGVFLALQRRGHERT